jgi:hypothetical protein
VTSITSFAVPPRPRDAEDVVVYYEASEFAAWPFSHGMWCFPGDAGGELVIGFSRGASRYAGADDVSHKSVNTSRGEFATLRSSDGGRTWPLETLGSLGTHHALESALLEGKTAAAPSPALDWRSPDFCLTAGFAQPPESAPNMGYVQYSRDRGHTWEGPFRIPAFGFTWLQVKPTYLVRPDGLVLLFVTVKRENAATYPPTRFVAVLASPDGGVTWRYLSSIQATTPDLHFVNRYYASPVLLPDGRIVVALRCQPDGINAWPEIFESEDGGLTWRFVSRVSEWGGPTALQQLRDGRLLAVYGYRTPPYGIRARVSEDGGRTWGAELGLRTDGGSHDLGYPRVVQRTDGKVVASYYFNRKDDPIQYNGGVRHIAATIFTP